MANIKRELDDLRFEIQREKATVNAIKRQLKRLAGEEVIHSTIEYDSDRIRNEAISDPDDSYDLEIALGIFKARLNERFHKAAALKDELHSRFPLTPCALYRLLKYDAQQQKKLKRRKRRRA